MYIYIYVFIYIYTYIYIYILYVCMSVCMYVCMYVCMPAYIHLSTLTLTFHIKMNMHITLHCFRVWGLGF